MAYYLLVEIVDTGINLIDKVDDSRRLEVLKSKKNNQQLWTVDSYTSGVNQINDYNNRLSNVVRDKNIEAEQAPVEIPKWDLSKLTSSDKKRIKKLYENKDYVSIMQIHNDKMLTELIYCCKGYYTHIDYNMQWI